jgi:hypothetical protein
MSDTEHKEVTPVETTAVENPRSTSPAVYTYATLMETSGEESESWYYFIRYQGNEEALEHLNKQLESVDWYVVDDLCTFDLELQYLVSEQTAKEMTKIDMNHTAHHRKFDGTLDMITFSFKSKDKVEKKMKRVYSVLSYGQIEDYVDAEDLDEEDLTSHEQSESESDESASESEESEDEPKERRKKAPKGIPPALASSTLPRFAKAKRRNRKH